MITLVACGGDDDETAAPVPPAQRFVTEEDAPGTKPDPVETRQTREHVTRWRTARGEALFGSSLNVSHFNVERNRPLNGGSRLVGSPVTP
jgi:hypothetical protein